jgi:hypothetical protein
MHHFQLKCPKELGVMMGEVSLSRIEQLLLGISSELRPTLAEGDPTVSVLVRGHSHECDLASPRSAPHEGVGFLWPR